MNAPNLIAAPLDQSLRVMPPGMFFGQPSVERRVGELLCSVRDADPTRIIERHTHSDAHFVLVLDGAYVSSARNVSGPSDGPLLIYNPPGTTHQDHFAGRHGVFTGRFFTLSIPATMEVDAGATQPLEGTARAVHHPNAVMLARQLARECQRWNQLSSLEIETLGYELLQHVLTAIRPLERRAPAWIHRSIEQLHAAHAGRVSINDLARESGVHPVYLARAFRRFVGCGPAELQRTLRVKRALMLIRGTRQSFSSISASCGFADQSHMNRAVRSLTGCTPSALRSVRHAATA